MIEQHCMSNYDHEPCVLDIDTIRLLVNYGFTDMQGFPVWKFQVPKSGLNGRSDLVCAKDLEANKLPAVLAVDMAKTEAINIWPNRALPVLSLDSIGERDKCMTKGPQVKCWQDISAQARVRDARCVLSALRADTSFIWIWSNVKPRY
jgi:hypothetical protein